MTTSMSYCFFRNILPELNEVEDMLENLLLKDPESVSLSELKAAKLCCEFLGQDRNVGRVEEAILSAKQAQGVAA